MKVYILIAIPYPDYKDIYDSDSLNMCVTLDKSLLNEIMSYYKKEYPNRYFFFWKEEDLIENMEDFYRENKWRGESK